MRERLTHNFGLKLLSLALAILVWIVVLSIEDPVYTREFSDISVTEVNGDQITEAGKAYSYVGGNTVSVKVKGKTSVVNRLQWQIFPHCRLQVRSWWMSHVRNIRVLRSHQLEAAQYSRLK